MSKLLSSMTFAEAQQRFPAINRVGILGRASIFYDHVLGYVVHQMHPDDSEIWVEEWDSDFCRFSAFVKSGERVIAVPLYD